MTKKDFIVLLQMLAITIGFIGMLALLHYLLDVFGLLIEY